MYGGGGMYGGMYGGGMYGANPGQSRGMLALERFAFLVNSLCFTAETIEHSMQSMEFFWGALLRIKDWGTGGVTGFLRFVKSKCRGLWNILMYMLGRRRRLDSKFEWSKTLMNILLLYLTVQLGRFAWKEFTKPSLESFF